MRTYSRWIQSFASVAVQSLGRIVTLTIGFVLMVVGLGMMVTIVMLPLGIILDLLGLMIVLAAIFAPDNRESSAR